MVQKWEYITRKIPTITSIYAPNTLKTYHPQLISPKHSASCEIDENGRVVIRKGGAEMFSLVFVPVCFLIIVFPVIIISEAYIDRSIIQEYKGVVK